MKLKLITSFLIASVFSFATMADVLKLREDHPETYIVVKGDTLWDISAHFLNTPWLWPRLWQANSQIANPHLIYPGDVLNLIWVDGQPRLTRKQLKKISPTPRLAEKLDPVPTIPLNIISPFLSKDHVIDANLLTGAPLVLGDAASTPAFFEGDTFYGKGQFNANNLYGVYRLKAPYLDPETSEDLGSKLIFLGHAEVSKNSDYSATEQVTPVDFINSKREARQGDLILPLPEYDSLPAFFLPQPVPASVKGHILGATTDASVIAQWDTIVINKGQRDNITIGSMFAIMQSGPEVLIHQEDGSEEVEYKANASRFDKQKDADIILPPKQVGELMVFKVYEKVSIGIVMRSTELIKTDNTIKGIEF
jgi:hypothetical protein